MGWVLVGSRPDCYETGVAQQELFEDHPVTYLRSIADPDAGFAALQQNESPVRFRGKQISFAGAIRAEGLKGWAGLWIRVDGTDSRRPLAYKRMADSPITGSRDWARYALTVDVPGDATLIAYGIVLYGEGTLWLSDFTLAVEGEEIKPEAQEVQGPSAAAGIAGRDNDPRSTSIVFAGRIVGPQASVASEPPSPVVPRITSQQKRQSVSGFDVWPAEECPTFAAIGGMQSVKDQLASTVGLVLTDPRRAAQLKISFTGVLLYGPAGTGKSLFGRALAGEYGCNLVLVLGGELRRAPNDLGQRLDEAFLVARSRAPSILFFDEFDWLWTQPDRRPLLDGLLERLQRTLGAASGDARVIPVAATQALDNIDPSVIPSGLFDLKIRVGLPDASARSAILEAQLRGRPIASDVDTSTLVAATEGLSAAALSGVVNAAALKALGRKEDPQAAITQADLLAAIRERGGRDRPALEQWSWEALILPAETKRELQELQRIIEDPSRAQRFGVVPPRGALLYGPPGTGKTTIARVLAAQAKSSFYPIKGSDIVSKWLGESEQRVHDLFVRARENRPSIIFLDEIDALGAARGSADSSAMDRILNQLLQEIDGLQSGAGTFVLGATNRRDLLDEALVRGGRLGRQIEIPSPDLDGRTALLKSFTKSMPLTSDVDLNQLAVRTDGLSGADLQQLCQQAAIHAMMRSSSEAAEVTIEDFDTALRKSPPRVTH